MNHNSFFAPTWQNWDLRLEMAVAARFFWNMELRRRLFFERPPTEYIYCAAAEQLYLFCCIWQVKVNILKVPSLKNNYTGSQDPPNTRVSQVYLKFGRVQESWLYLSWLHQSWLARIPFWHPIDSLQTPLRHTLQTAKGHMSDTLQTISINHPDTHKTVTKDQTCRVIPSAKS